MGPRLSKYFLEIKMSRRLTSTYLFLAIWTNQGSVMKRKNDVITTNFLEDSEKSKIITIIIGGDAVGLKI